MMFSLIYIAILQNLIFHQTKSKHTQVSISYFLMEFMKNHDLEYDDEAYYIELRRQILLLTADEDEEFPHAIVSNSIPADPQRVSSRLLTSSSSCAVLQTKEGSSCLPLWDGEDSTNSASTWLVNLRSTTGYGTGVFIPQNQILQSRRRYRPKGICTFISLYLNMTES